MKNVIGTWLRRHNTRSEELMRAAANDAFAEIERAGNAVIATPAVLNHLCEAIIRRLREQIEAMAWLQWGILNVGDAGQIEVSATADASRVAQVIITIPAFVTAAPRG